MNTEGIIESFINKYKADFIKVIERYVHAPMIEFNCLRMCEELNDCIDENESFKIKCKIEKLEIKYFEIYTIDVNKFIELILK